jgi:hypothetical protein
VENSEGVQRIGQPVKLVNQRAAKVKDEAGLVVVVSKLKSKSRSKLDY